MYISVSDPNPVIGTSNLPTWRPTSKYPVEYARLGSKLDAMDDGTLPALLRMEKALLQHRVDFWRELKAHLPVSRRPQQHNEL